MKYISFVKTLIIQLVAEGQTLLKLEYLTELPQELLLERIQNLVLEKSPEKPQEKQEPEVLSEVSPKYERLAQWLSQQKMKSINVTFSQIENELGRTLPDSARTQRAWWANTLTHSQATAWMVLGWKSSNIDLDGETVTFERSQ
jgi:hypothetical protein